MRNPSLPIFGRRLLAVALATLFMMGAASALPPDATVEAERKFKGISLLALSTSGTARQEISVLPAHEGLDKLTAALSMIDRESPSNARIIARLKKAGNVTLVYYPNNFRDRNRLNTQTVALFLPNFLGRKTDTENRPRFVVVINQFGVKWPVAELAAVVVHELAGHGLQHLNGRIADGRMLDLECEASLYQERAYQDFGVEKKMRTVVLFRRQMEYHYCSDFRRYISDRAPTQLTLWDTLNPDVPKLLQLFGDYRGTQTARTGFTATAQLS